MDIFILLGDHSRLGKLAGTLNPCLYAQGGQPTDELLVAQELADLVDRVGCSRCVVWGKSDAVVALIREASPELRLGYVVVNESAAQRSSGLDQLLRMPSVQVRSKFPQTLAKSIHS